MNREKTEQTIFEDAMGCTCENAYVDMVKIKERFHKKDGVQGYHLVQSFAEGEVSPELAHLIGQELAEQLLKGQYEVVITTHLNTSHYHNHLVWNSVSMVDGKKYHSNAKSYFTEVRQISDQLCRKYGLSVIQTNQGKAMHYAQWKAEAEGKPTWRTAIRMDIQEAIGVSFSWSQFVKEMEKRGYAWKLNRKYPSLKTPGMERYIRLRSLGKGYGEAEIREKILRPKIRQVYGNTQMQSPRRKLTGLQRLYYSYLYQMGYFQKSQADSLCSTFRYPEAGPKDLPNGISTKGRDHNQGRTGSIPEALGRTGTFFDERAQGIIPESTRRYAHSGNQWGIKRTSKEDPLKSED
ncbi:MAG: relaxase/mobilization nuclease domain-containing protein [Dorea sp.]